eukprot:scaffold99548_cov63-Attheya_sp.AAC.1
MRRVRTDALAFGAESRIYIRAMLLWLRVMASSVTVVRGGDIVVADSAHYSIAIALHVASVACIAWHTHIPHAYAPHDMTGDVQTRHCDAARGEPVTPDKASDSREEVRIRTINKSSG